MISRRAASNVLIAAFLLFQIVTPLRYYMSGGGADERFAWRMFSTTGMRSCSVSVTETVNVAGSIEEHPLDLEKAVQARWLDLLKRYDPLMVNKFLEVRCKRDAIVKVQYESSCETPDGGRTPAATASLDCSSLPMTLKSDS